MNLKTKGQLDSHPILSTMKGNFHVRFLEESGRVIAPSYSAGGWKASALLQPLDPNERNLDNIGVIGASVCGAGAHEREKPNP